MNNLALKKYSLRISIILASFLVGYVVFQNVKPLGGYTLLSLSNKEVTSLGPADRITVQMSDGAYIQRQIDDLVYFTTKIPEGYKRAEVKIIFKNPYQNQEIFLGPKDQEIWHYDTKLVDTRLLDNLEWSHTGTDVVVYQKAQLYNSSEEFIKNPPQDKIIGLYGDEKENLFNLQPTVIKDYKPEPKDTIIGTPLRGPHTFYTYLNGEPFKLSVEKHRLGLTESSDKVSINIYKDGDLVYQTSSSDNLIHMQNPGNDLPEPGVYKVVIGAGYDIMITKIITNLHKIVFEGPLFPASNNDIYPDVNFSTDSTDLYTNASVVKFYAPHQLTLQEIQIEDNDVVLDETKKEKYYSTTSNGYKFSIPKSDVLVDGSGFFAFTKDQFFLPTDLQILKIRNEADLSRIDYLVTRYNGSTVENGWRIATQSFDLTDTIPSDKGILSWLVRSPGLKNKQRGILIKDIQVSFYKEPIINKLRLNN